MGDSEKVYSKADVICNNGKFFWGEKGCCTGIIRDGNGEIIVFGGIL